jgi:hypothetical protein
VNAYWGSLSQEVSHEKAGFTLACPLCWGAVQLAGGVKLKRRAGHTTGGS